MSTLIWKNLRGHADKEPIRTFGNSEETTRADSDLGPAFWSNQDGWTTLSDATIFIEKPDMFMGIVMTYDVAVSMVKLFALTELAEIE